MQVRTKFIGIFVYEGYRIKSFCNIVRFADVNLKQIFFFLIEMTFDLANGKKLNIYDQQKSP